MRRLFSALAMAAVALASSGPRAQSPQTLTFSGGVSRNATFQFHRINGPACNAGFESDDDPDPPTPPVVWLNCGGLFGNRVDFDVFANSTLRPGWRVTNVSLRSEDDGPDGRHTFSSIRVSPLPSNPTNPFVRIRLTAKPASFVSVTVAVEVAKDHAGPNDNPLALCLVGGDKTRRGNQTLAYKCRNNSDCSGKFVCAADPCGQGLFCVSPLRNQ